MVVAALEKAFKVAKPEILNSDQGSQFMSADYIEVLKKNKVQISMDGKSRWADNIKIERWFRTLKYEEIYLDDADYAKKEFRQKWDKRYPNILKSWDKNWSELTVFFEYPQEIRKIIYTTNVVEGYHRMVRKFTKKQGSFPNR